MRSTWAVLVIQEGKNEVIIQRIEIRIVLINRTFCIVACCHGLNVRVPPEFLGRVLKFQICLVKHSSHRGHISTESFVTKKLDFKLYLIAQLVTTELNSADLEILDFILDNKEKTLKRLSLMEVRQGSFRLYCNELFNTLTATTE